MAKIAEYRYPRPPLKWQPFLVGLIAVILVRRQKRDFLPSSEWTPQVKRMIPRNYQGQMFSAATNMHLAGEQRTAQPLLHTSLRSQSEDRAAAWRLRLLIAALFLPEGLSFFVGEFRLTVARALLIIFTATTLLNRQRSARTFALSDFFALAAAAWMLLAGTANEGFAGLKGAGIAAIEFTGCYYVFRCSLASVDSSVRMVRYAGSVLVVVVAIALLDPLTGKLFTYEFAKGLTGYAKPIVEEALAQHAEAMFRNGLLRAMGPLEHSILFGCVCAWFGTLAFFTFPHRLFGQSIAAFALVGLWFSQARGAWVAYVIAFALSGYFAATKQFPMRWKLIGSITAFALVLIFSFSGAPIATLMRLAGLSPEAAYYRQGIWATAAPMVAHSPLFGIGSSWDWQSSMDLYGPSVDAFWLQNSMTYGIPDTLFVFLTMISPFWRGPIHDSPYLTAGERRLSVALGIVTVTAVFLGFIVHFWGVCWILLGAFAATRASLADCATLRHRTEQALDAHQHPGRIAAPIGARLRA